MAFYFRPSASVAKRALINLIRPADPLYVSKFYYNAGN